VKLRQRLQSADLCITGEGKLDAQTLSGKTVIGVAKACEDAGVPCIALAGTIGEGAEDCLSAGLTSFHSITDRPMTLEESMLHARTLLARSAANILRTNLAHRARETPWSSTDDAEQNK
jgi:glycerate kinase